MKKFMKLFALIMAVLALSACGGGGGGGSSNITPEPSLFDFTFNDDPLSLDMTTPPVTTWAEISNMPATSGVFYSISDDDGTYTMTKHTDSIALQVSEGGAFDHTLYLSLASNFRDDGDYVSGTTTSTSAQTLTDGSKVFDGNLTITDKISFGGKNITSYAEFGIWQRNIRGVGTVDGAPYDQTIRYVTVPFFYIDEAKRSNQVDPSYGDAIFEGDSIATAWEIDGLSVKNRDLTGTAELIINVADPSNAELLLKFNGFYDFTFTGIDTENFSFQLDDASVSATANGANSTGINLPTSLKGDLDIKFAGPKEKDTAAATGIFDIYNDAGSKGVLGAFGVVDKR